jgi:hypothetical protein
VQIKPDFEWVTDHFECAADDSTVVNFYTDELVYPDGVVPGTLVCFNNCPDAGILNNQNPFNDYSNPEYGVVPEASTHSEYTFDSARLVLVDGDTDVVTTTPAENFQWGLMSGPLFDPAYLNNLACDLDGDLVNESTCGWLGWSELAEYYTWETGPNDWNQFTALENPPPPDGDGSIVPFEPPLLVSYTHTWEDFTQSTFYLEYSGFGNLQGIPGKCVDQDTGQEMPCGSESRWLPQFNIDSGTEVTDAADDTIYRVKQLEKEQRMAEAADPASCAELTLKPYTLPDLADWVDPNIGLEPVVEGAPAVIGGVIGGATK